MTAFDYQDYDEYKRQAMDRLSGSGSLGPEHDRTSAIKGQGWAMLALAEAIRLDTQSRDR